MIAENLTPLLVLIGSVKPDARNARLHPQPNLDALKRSLEAYGQRKPVFRPHELSSKTNHKEREPRERHPETVKASRERMYRTRRLRVFGMLGGAACRNCGCDELSFLELNHKNGGGCQDLREIGNRLYDLILKGERVPADYEVLCRVCNALDHLKRKNPEQAAGFQVDYTGQKAVRLAD